MDRESFANEMRIQMNYVKSKFFAEYWSGNSCMKKDEEQKLLNAIRKIFLVLENMEVTE